MKKLIKITIVISLNLLTILLLLNEASAYWLWTPETKKFINPKYAVKDSPKEQFDWGMSFYNAKDYERAAAEFDKLTKQYEYSEYASKAQYHAGLCYENMAKFYIAFQNYQKTIDNFPHVENIDEIVARQFNIANIYASKDNPKVLGTDIMTSLDRAAEIYRKVVDNAPYGKLADEALFRMGEVFKHAERYDEAIQAYQRIVDDYPTSKYLEKSQYEIAHCAYKASLKPAYDVEPTDKAIKAFERFAETSSDKELTKNADKTIQRLKDKIAEKSLITARFYESQKHYESAIVYYQDIINRFPDSSFVGEAKAKIEELKNIKSGEKSKGWFQFGLGKKPAAPETQETKKVATETPEPKKSKPWTPFSLGKKPATPETKEEAAKPKKWIPFSFEKKDMAPEKQEIPEKKEGAVKTQEETPKAPEEAVKAPEEVVNATETATTVEEPVENPQETEQIPEEAATAPEGAINNPEVVTEPDKKEDNI